MRGSQPWKTNRARILRSQETSVETILWRALRNRQLGGHKFLRQVPIEPYVVDFLCRNAKLAVEIDGATHNEPGDVTRDTFREGVLRSLGYRIYRVTNDDVRQNLSGVLDGILQELELGLG